MLTRRRISDTATYDELVISPLAHAVSLATTARGPMSYSGIARNWVYGQLIAGQLIAGQLSADS